jgi:UDP-N-acetyl-D-mannosaminuronic acid dehydrogenase
MILDALKKFHAKHDGQFDDVLSHNTVCVSGLGYIGLPTAALLANRGYSVHGVDVNAKTIEIINSGAIHIVEPDLDMFVHAAVGAGRLKASLAPVESDVFMLCVPTPFFEDEGGIPKPDLKYVVSATKAIAPFVKKHNIVILESTCPVGATELVERTLREEGVNTDELYIAYCPERVLPGKVMYELVENDRIVGGRSEDAKKVVGAFYETFVVGEVLLTDDKTAEMSKLTENACRDSQIAFANELSMTCDTLGINVWELIRLANHHPRINILNPGTGVGGHCIAVDPWFIVDKDPTNTKLIAQARRTNDYKTEWCIEKVKAAAYKFKADTGKEPTVACMGLAFKPDIDDLRESPAMKVREALKVENFNLLSVEPNLEDQEGNGLTSFNDAIEQADIVVFLVAHQQFYILDNKIVLDFCGIQK